MCCGNSRANKTTSNLQFLFFARGGVKIRKGIPRYLRVLRKMPFNGVEKTFLIHRIEGMSVTMMNFQRFSCSLVIFRPFFLSLLIYLKYVLLYNWRIHHISYYKIVFI